MILSLLSLEEHPLTRPVETVIRNLENSGYEPTLKPAEYGLTELSSNLTKGHQYREFIAKVGRDQRFMIVCSPPRQQFIGNCELEFQNLDIKVNVHVSFAHLKDWQEIHNKTVSLLNEVRKD
jgi:vacuolar-type H+-ATPase subunit C/Vma6